jgi:hypothetical protein
VEAGDRTGRRVVLVEPQVQNDEVAEEQGGDGAEDGNYDDEEDDGSSTSRAGRDVRERGGTEIWHEKLPILSGGMRRAGADAEYGGQAVEVGMVLRRWFKFGRGEWEHSGFT